MADWWVNQNKSFAEERKAGILWAPLLTNDGRRQKHWDSMLDLQPGDRVIHYANARISAISEVATKALAQRRPNDLVRDVWQDEGRLVRTVYNDVRPAILMREIPLEWRLDGETSGPFQKYGGVKQGYLFPLSAKFTDELFQQFGDRFPPARNLLPAEAAHDAIDLLRGLAGTELLTINGQPNTILSVNDVEVLVSTTRSPAGQSIPVRDVQAALESLRRHGRIIIDPNNVGYQSAFIGAVLIALPGAQVAGSPPRISFNATKAEVNLSASPENFTEATPFDGDLDLNATVRLRGEQRLLRQRLIGSSDVAQCALCGESYPVKFLVAAHIKKRAACTDDERRDLSNIAMLACTFGCDALFEFGHISVNPDGKIVCVKPNDDTALRHRLLQLSDRYCTAHTKSSQSYFSWHRTNRFLG